MVQTFRAKDMKDALSAMRAALGDDAVILSSEKTGDGNVLVCAASGQKEEAAQAKPATLGSFETRYHDKLIARLRNKTGAPAERLPSFSRPELLTQLHTHRLPDALAHALAEAADGSGFTEAHLALASALDKRMQVAPVDVRKERAVLLIGPNGSGKTAVAGKLAAEAVAAGRPVRLAAADMKSAGQRERLETFAVHLDVPVLDASTPRLLSEAAAQARQDNAFLVVDSGGFDLRRPPHEILLYTRMGCAEPLGVLSAATDAEEAGDQARLLADLGVKRLIVTCLDTIRRKGSAAVLASSGLAIAHATSSPYLVEGLDSLTPPALARALLSPLDGPTSEA